MSEGDNNWKDTALTNSSAEDLFDITGDPGLREILGSIYIYMDAGTVADWSDSVLLSSVDPGSRNSETQGELTNFTGS